MRFNVAQLLMEPVGASREYDFRDEHFDVGDEIGRAAVEGHCRALRTSRGLLVTGWLEAHPRLSCSRCLEEFEATVKATFEEEYLPIIDVRTGLPVRPPEGEDTPFFYLDQNHELDLSELVRQHVLVSLPLKPLCKEACAGLCPQCGANLNEGPCGCKPLPSQSPFGALEDLLRED